MGDSSDEDVNSRANSLQPHGGNVDQAGIDFLKKLGEVGIQTRSKTRLKILLGRRSKIVPLQELSSSGRR
jgi:hypothetical protein